MDTELWRARFIEAMALRNCSPRSMRDYGYEVVRFLCFLEAHQVGSLSAVTQEVVEAYRRHLLHRTYRGRGLVAGTQATRLAMVRSFLRFLFERRYVLVDAGASVRGPRVAEGLPRGLLTEAEVGRLVEAPDPSSPRGLRDRTILEVLYGTALRNSELRGLAVADVHLPRGELAVRHGKGGRSRVLPLGDEAFYWLKRYLTEVRPGLGPVEDGALLFVGPAGAALSGVSLTGLVAAAARRAGLSGRVTPHQLRLACATHMLARGAGLRHVQELLGHVCLTSTQRYTRVELTDLREAHRRFHPREGRYHR